jgi:hypothetical protein
MKRSYWKEHPIDVILTIAGILLGIYPSSQVIVALSDPLVRSYIVYGYLPTGTTIVPFNDPQRYFSEEPHLVKGEPISLLNWVDLFSPFIAFGLTTSIEYVRYNRWKKSIQKKKI